MRSQVAFLLMLATSVVASDRWSQFRGPDAAGVSEQVCLWNSGLRKTFAGK